MVYCVIIVLILLQILFTVFVFNNYRYALNKYKRKREYIPKVTLIIPCKGLDEDFDKNITSFIGQDYDHFKLWFVVEDSADAAYGRLNELKNKLAKDSKASDIQIFIAGKTKYSSQKIHNLLYCYKQINDDTAVLAFADSDICVRTDWLRHLVYPLIQPRIGASTGYRWFIPLKDTFANLALSATNAKVVQLMGNSRVNQVWGGSMAIKLQLFKEIKLEEKWQQAISDDLLLSINVKRAKKKVAFVPACLAASCINMNWSEVCEFSKRQFLITKIAAPFTWFWSLLSAIFSTAGLWIGIFLAAYSAITKSENTIIYSLFALSFFICQLIRAIIRQKLAIILLDKYSQTLKAHLWVDVLLFWLWGILLLLIIISSAFGRTIKWRGIKYRLISATQTQVLQK